MTNPFAAHQEPRFSRTLSVLLVLGLLVSSLHAEAPDQESAMQGWTTGRTWLDQNQLPDLDSPAAVVPMNDVEGVSVVLRLNGRTVGSASEFSDDDQLLRRVLGRAFARALGDRTIGNLPDELRNEAASRLTLEIEYAAAPVPLLGNDLSAAVTRVRPGLDGLAVRRNNDWSYTFPGRAVATGTADSATSNILRMVADLGLPPRDLPALRELDRVGVYRFDTTRIAQSTPSTAPFVANRSGATVSRDDVRGDRLVEFGDSILKHLLAHLTTTEQQEKGAPILLGDFDPVADRYQPIEAPALERALTAWAFATAAGTPALDPGLREHARAAAMPLLKSLPPIQANTPLISTDLAIIAASRLATLPEEPDAEAVTFLQTHAAELLKAGPIGTLAEQIRRVAALASIPIAIVPTADHAKISRFIERVWNDVDGNTVIPSLDWFAVAEQAWMERTGETSLRMQTLLDARSALLTRQLDQRSDADLEGGIALQLAARHRVDARILRTALGMAILTNLQGNEAPENASSAVEGMLRFARQLQVRPDDASLFRGGHRGIGGLRQAPWSPNQPLAAESTALLLVCEALD